MKSEYYPSPNELLNELGMECILVGSCTKKPFAECKDIDFVVSDRGLALLKQGKWSYYLTWDSDRWACYIPLGDTGQVLEFFNGICAIQDETKWSSRITYEQAVLLPLCVKTVEGVEVLSL